MNRATLLALRAPATAAPVLLAVVCAMAPAVPASGIAREPESAAPAAAAAPDFASAVRPILEASCFECHGDEAQRGGLRLDLRSPALRGGGGGAAIVPGDPAASGLLARVAAPEGDEERMPPKGTGLAEAEIAVLRDWIAAGAPWPDAHAGVDERLDHWAWQPLSGAVPPAGQPEDHPVDAFLREKLEAAGLAMSPEADRRTLIRRLARDLHGLPPSPEEVEAFVADPRPDAWERLVDRTLDSPRYGERFAQHWLDIAHYADTHGFERDMRRDHAWRYRDYVIRAFNEDKPYDRFLLEQIAGDVLWPGDPEAVVATGFLAAGPWDFVGQVETKSDELRRGARALDLDDMVSQVMSAATALTVSCARCHDHKLDPISQEEYYRLWAVFSGVKRGDRPADPARVGERVRLAAEKAAVAAELAALSGASLDLADIVGGGDGLGTGRPGLGLRLDTGEASEERFGRPEGLRPNEILRPSYPEGLPVVPGFVDAVLVPRRSAGEGSEAEAVPLSSAGTLAASIPPSSGQAWDAVRNGPLQAQVSTELAGIDFAAEGHSLLGLHANAAVTFDLEAIRMHFGFGALRLKATAGFGANPSARNSKADLSVYLDGEPVFQRLGLAKDAVVALDLPLGAGARFLTLMATDGGDGIGNDLLFFGDPRLVPEIDPADLSEAERERLESLARREREIAGALEALGEDPEVYAAVPGDPEPVHLLRRGEPEQPEGPVLAPGAPGLLPALDPELGPADGPEGERRAALARWIVDERNPLTPRVAANRLWHWLFGQGLVATPSDFGRGGGEPSHPELLDWLAAELRREDWSLKAMQRLLLTSEAYRQDSRFSPGAAGALVDAGNRLLWRQNPRRLDAESIRDAVLATSGSLNLEAGGPGFEDFRYEQAYAPIYTHLTADEPALWRRSIYRYVVRTTPSRFLATLDCPDPANLTPARLTTTTALQSLALYNNEFMLRQARRFAERVEREAGEDASTPVSQSGQSAQITLAYRLAYAREPEGGELEEALDFIREHGLFSLCRALLNSSEFLVVD